MEELELTMSGATNCAGTTLSAGNLISAAPPGQPTITAEQILRYLGDPRESAHVSANSTRSPLAQSR